MRSLRTLVAGLVGMLLTAPAVAQYPAKPLRIIVAAGPGSSPDIRARQIATPLARALGQPVLVENRPGANGALGTREAASSAPDGYTLLLAGVNQLLQEVVNAEQAYPFVRLFDPVTLLASGPMLWVASATLEARTIGEALALARGRPGRLTYASLGPGSAQQLGAMLVEQIAGISLHEVPYKTMAQEFPDLISGEIATTMTFYSAAAPHLRSGRARALAVASQQRLAVLPDVPTFAEAGLPGINVKGWLGFVVPLGTPPATIQRLNQELVRIIRSPEVNDQLVATGAEVDPGSPEEFAAYLRSEIELWTRLVRDRGLRPN